MNKLVLTGILAVFTLALSGTARADFVCPVLPANQNAVNQVSDNANWITISGGDTSILPGAAGDPASSPVSVPDQATNMNGAGSPGGTHAGPGDSGYTAVWNS